MQELTANIIVVFKNLTIELAGAIAKPLPKDEGQVIARIGQNEPFYVYKPEAAVLDALRKAEAAGAENDIERLREELKKVDSFRRRATSDEAYEAEPLVPVD